ncbi:MAG TPA: DnaJ domain-containing protein [Micavibrio sp.]
MPYALLILGILAGLYGLYMFFLNATPKQTVTMATTVITGALALALLLLALTGRLPLAIAILAALWPIGLSVWKSSRKRRPAATPGAKPMSRAEALDILGLPEPASAEDINDAYKRLMMKLHPDQQGSEWMAAKLNEARDFLIGKP